MNQQFLILRLRAAIAARLTTDIQQLLDGHGVVAFSRALSAWSPRVVADGLSLLPPFQREVVLHHVPSRLRDALQRVRINRGSGVSSGFPQAPASSARIADSDDGHRA